MTDMERKNLRRAMYSREAARTEEDEEGERSQSTTATTVNNSLIPVGALLTSASHKVYVYIIATYHFPFPVMSIC